MSFSFLNSQRRKLTVHVQAIHVTLAILLFMQVSFLTPSLEKRAERIMADELAGKKHASKTEEKIFKILTAKVTLQRTPPKALHQVYVLLEVVKLVLLMYYAFTLAQPTTLKL